MKIAPVAEVKEKFSAYLKAATKGPVIVTRHGKPVAVLISIEDEEELDRLILAYTPKFREILDVSREQIRQTEGIEHEAFWQEVEAEIE